MELASLFRLFAPFPSLLQVLGTLLYTSCCSVAYSCLDYGLTDSFEAAEAVIQR